jgi:hypothetical protein
MMAKPAAPAAEATGASSTSVSGVNGSSSGVDDDGIRGVTIPPASDDDGGECHPELIVMLTSHKTGTAQAGWVARQALQLGRLVLNASQLPACLPALAAAVATSSTRC